MKPFEIGDIVSVLNDEISGKVIESGKVYTTIENQDGLRLKLRTGDLVLKPALSSYELNDISIKDADVASNKIDFKQAKISSSKRVSTVPEIDLHLEALSDKIYLESHHQILQKQLTAFKNFFKKSVEKKYNRIVVIHGKGEGILKAEIHLFLNRIQKDDEPKIVFRDADLNEYGAGGATEIMFNWKA